MDDTKKRRLEEIFRAGLKAVDPEEAIRRHVQLAGDHLLVGGHSYPLASFKRIIVTGFGKGAAPMAKALEEILGDRLTEGSSSMRSSGRDMSPRAMDTYCCSPPESVPARWSARSLSQGNNLRTVSRVSAICSWEFIV